MVAEVVTVVDAQSEKQSSVQVPEFREDDIYLLYSKLPFSHLPVNSCCPMSTRAGNNFLLIKTFNYTSKATLSNDLDNDRTTTEG